MKTKKHLIILLAFFSIVFISCLSSSRAEGNTINHTVKRGETLYSLARKYNSSVDVIMQSNNIRNPRDLKVGMKLVIPPKVANRISNRNAGDEDAGETNSVRGRGTNVSYSTNGLMFSYPLNGKLLSRFGYRKYSRRSRKVHFHTGIDIKGQIGAAIRSAEAGIVIFSGRMRGYGKVVKIRHAGGFSTAYAHNSVNLVRKGQSVVKGQLIARVGMTGRTTGSHVHFEIRYKNKALNPLKYLGARIAVRGR